MHFSVTPDQAALRDAVRDLLATAKPEAVWDELARMGLFGALVPEADGGLGLSEVDIVPVLIEVGYSAVPHPVAETVLAAPLLAGDPRLSDVVGGRLKVALAHGDLVAFGGDLVLVPAAPVRLVVPPSATVQSSVDDTRPLLRVSLPPDGVLSVDPAGVARRVALATAAQLVGLGRRMLDLTVSYVSNRRQFGVPVGSFQAVKHHLADALLKLEFAAPAVLAAGATLTQQGVSMAAVLSAEAATDTARAAIQCHGAMGYTVEYELHRFAKRAWALAATIDIDEHLAHIAEGLELT